MSNVAVDVSLQKFMHLRLPDIAPKSVQEVITLHGEGATVPFMARYRKERTNNLNEQQIRDVIDTFNEYNELIPRKEFVLAEIEKQGNLTAELKSAIETCFDLSALEEIYRPFKRKKKTKATLAREAGLAPFADWIWDIGHGQTQANVTLEVKAKEFINPSAGYATYDEVLRGAQHIIVEKLSNNPELRQLVRNELYNNGKVISQKTTDYKTHSKYAMYADYKEPVKSLEQRKASHRYLALRRGWQESELKVTIEGDEASLLKAFEAEACNQPGCLAAPFLQGAAKIALTIHVMPSITNELHSQLKEKADIYSIVVFADNVRRVLMSSPFGAKVVLGVDPGIRTGCKIALIDKSGHFMTHTVLQLQGDDAKDKAKTLFGDVFKQIKIDAIAVGNGTGGREAEQFIRSILKEIGVESPVIMISESGASVYSASDVAREEFPDLDLTVRGAISIARRLQDPLAELVKLEPKSIGVGQYQHDVNQGKLKKKLHEVVESCVNQVGVELNTASTSLLQYISGIGPATARNIVQYRREHGLFKDRQELLKVPNFSPKVFEQAAGFLRLNESKVTLDRTGIHPERYSAVREMASELGVNVAALIGEGAKKLATLRTKWIELVGEFTFDDIVRELEKPGRDPRDLFKVFQYRDDIHELKDLKPGMICPGLVTNVTNFGAFVDIGVHQDGLVHISELSYEFVDDPSKLVNPGDQVQVKVLTVDLDKNQIALTMKLEERPRLARREEATADRPRAPRPRANRGAPVDARGGDGKGRPNAAGRGGHRAGGKGGKPMPGKASPKPKPTKSPFNNPFAALTGLKDEN